MSLIIPPFDPEFWQQTQRCKYELAIVEKLAPTAVKPIATFLKFMDEWTKDIGGWNPHNLFYTTSLTINSYTVCHDHIDHDAFLGCGTSKIFKIGDTKHYIRTVTNYTQIGQWFEDMPAIVSVVKLPYYVVMWPLTFVLVIVRRFISLFIPRTKSLFD